MQAQDRVIQLNGIDAYIDLNTPLLSTTDGSQPYTLEAWVKTSDGSDNCFISQYESILPNGDRFQFEIRNNKLNWWKGAPNSQIRLSILSVSDINDSVWHHIAGTRDAFGNVNIYIDGILEGTGFDTYPFIATSTRIGTRNSAGGFVNAEMDEVRIWDIARTQLEIQQTMNTILAGNEPGLIGYWNFDDDTADDQTSNNNNGSIFGSLQFSEDDNPLPVTLSSFTAVFSNGSSLLSWTTQSESNNLGWNVFRSDTDDISEGFQINGEMIEGAGTTTEQTDYSFSDAYETFPNNSYWYWIESVDQGGNTNLYGPVQTDIPDDDDELPPELISEYGLTQNFPNPFNPTTKIAFKLTAENAQDAELIIFNSKGQIVKVFDTLSTNDSEIGSVTWNGDDMNGNPVSSGMYFYKLTSFTQIVSKKMILMK